MDLKIREKNGSTPLKIARSLGLKALAARPRPLARGPKKNREKYPKFKKSFSPSPKSNFKKSLSHSPKTNFKKSSRPEKFQKTAWPTLLRFRSQVEII
jgi:hypothetical protein